MNVQNYLHRLKEATTREQFAEIEADAERDYEYGSLSEDEYEQIAGTAYYFFERLDEE